MSDSFGKGAELLNLDTVQRAIDAAAQYCGNEHARIMRYGMRGMIAGRTELMESPLEAIFYAWFSAVEDLLPDDVYRFVLVPQQNVPAPNGHIYRFDFTVLFGPHGLAEEARVRNIQSPRLAVELDGYDFHERTKEQVAYRNERDRVLQADGWTVLHFSGSELFRDPLACVQQVIEICKQRHELFSNEVYRSSAQDAARNQVGVSMRGTT